MISREKPDPRLTSDENGTVILVDKPLRWSSFKVIHELRKTTGVRKMGHAGTLDPMATGLLIVCTGRYTKQITTYQDMPKTYTGSITLGITTPSMDSETEPSVTAPWNHITEKAILAAVQQLTGTIQQLPPMYSAVNYGGKKLYVLARKGKVVKREPRQIQVHEFALTSIALPVLNFSITCSKGTYIRVLAHDLGELLGCGAYLSSLRRTAIGGYRVENAFSVDELRALYAEHAKAL